MICLKFNIFLLECRQSLWKQEYKEYYLLKHGYNQSSVIIFRSDFIYDIVEQMKPSAPTAGTKKSSRKRPTVSSQFKVSLHCFLFLLLLASSSWPIWYCRCCPFPSLSILTSRWFAQTSYADPREKNYFYCQQNSGTFWCYTVLALTMEW